MDNLLFLSVFFTVIMYLTIHIITSYKIISLNLTENHLRVDKLNDVNFLFKISLFSIGILFLMFVSFYMPQNFSLYINISIYMLIYFIGVVLIYILSIKSAKDLLYMNILINTVNIGMFSFPVLIVLLANGVQ